MAGDLAETAWLDGSVTVTSGKAMAVSDLNVFRYDVQLTLPGNYELTKNVTPTLAWEPYPGASYYKLYLLHDHAHVFIDYMVMTATTYTFSSPQQVGDYDWLVEAYNSEDIKIATSPTWYFTVEP